jgi:hypothetical protein
LGKTQVNKDIVKSIKDRATHKLFPLFHNGVTIICGELENDKNKIKINNYYVVNGCQSIESLYENRDALTDNLRILTKFIKMDIHSPLSEQVTRYSNNQNGVKPRDFQANNPIQIRLQNDFNNHYKDQYFFEIKRGEIPEKGILISNENAGLYLMSFDLKEPWSTHRKYQVFEEKHDDLFARPEVSADRIVLCQAIMEIIDDQSKKIENKLFAKYALTERAMLYMIRSILEKDKMAKDILTKPGVFVRDRRNRNHFQKCIKKIVTDVVIDINAEVKKYGEDFDYRGKLRDSKWVNDLCNNVVNSFLKLVERKRIPSFSDEWKRKNNIIKKRSSR